MDVPEISPADGVSVRVIAGCFGETRGPVSAIDAAPLYLDVHLAAGSALEIPVPRGHTAVSYCYAGSVEIAGDTLGHRRLALLDDGDAIALAAPNAAARALVIAGKPFNEPIARYGPFVMNSQQEIRQAIEDFRAGRF